MRSPGERGERCCGVEPPEPRGGVRCGGGSASSSNNEPRAALMARRGATPYSLAQVLRLTRCQAARRAQPDVGVASVRHAAERRLRLPGEDHLTCDVHVRRSHASTTG